VIGAIEKHAAPPKTFHWRGDIDRRVIAAVRFVNDVDGTPISGPLEIRGTPPAANQPADANNPVPLRVLGNRFGLYVIHGGRGFEAFVDAQGDIDKGYVNTFAPAPVQPPAETRIARLRVSDPLGRFMPADFDLPLPRSPQRNDPLHDTVFTPREVRLLPSPSAPTQDGWSVLHVLIRRQVATEPLPAVPQVRPLYGALVRVFCDNPNPPPAQIELARGITDWRAREDRFRPEVAEALVAIHGIPVTTWNTNASGSVLSEEREVRVEVRFDPNFDPKPELQPYDQEVQPNLSAMEAVAPGIVRGVLPDTLKLHAREKRNLYLMFNTLNQLTDTGPF